MDLEKSSDDVCVGARSGDVLWSLVPVSTFMGYSVGGRFAIFSCNRPDLTVSEVTVLGMIYWSLLYCFNSVSDCFRS